MQIIVLIIIHSHKLIQYQMNKFFKKFKKLFDKENKFCFVDKETTKDLYKENMKTIYTIKYNEKILFRFLLNLSTTNFIEELINKINNLEQLRAIYYKEIPKQYHITSITKINFDEVDVEIKLFKE